MDKHYNPRKLVRRSAKLTVFYIFLLLAFLATGCAEQEKEQEKTVAENSREMTIPVEGMSCNSCVANVKSTLKPMEGIQGVTVSLEHRNATIAYEPEKVSPEQVQQAINNLGYRAGEPVIKETEKQ